MQLICFFNLATSVVMNRRYCISFMHTRYEYEIIKSSLSNVQIHLWETSFWLC